VGPEAGFGDAEVALARDAGLAVCGLGTAILRAETAALVAVSLALAAGGALGTGAG
jgi:RsmE family RNA methyltransferase